MTVQVILYFQSGPLTWLWIHLSCGRDLVELIKGRGGEREIGFLHINTANIVIV